MNYLDRNEFNFKPSQLVVDTIKNFDLSKFAFYTRIYDQGKKSIFSVFLSEQFQVDEQQVLGVWGRGFAEKGSPLLPYRGRKQ